MKKSIYLKINGKRTKVKYIDNLDKAIAYLQQVLTWGAFCSHHEKVRDSIEICLGAIYEKNSK